RDLPANPEIQVDQPLLSLFLGDSINVGVQTMLRVNIDRAYAAAKRSGVPFNLAYPALASDQQGKGAFDPEFMKDLFASAVARGRGERPFVQEAGEALRGSLPAGK